MDGQDRAVIEALYRAFAGYERPATFRACPCGGCWGRPDTADLDVDELAVPSPGGDSPLRTLTEDERPRWSSWPQAEAETVGAYLDRFITAEWRSEWEDDD